MATRQDIIVGQEIIRYANIINDLLDVISYELKEIDPQTGLDLLKKVQPTEIGGEATYENYTDAELRLMVKKRADSVKVYKQALDEFIAAYGDVKTAEALKAYGITDLVAFKADITNLSNRAQYIIDNVLDTKNSKTTLSEYVDDNVAKLPLMRRRWGL